MISLISITATEITRSVRCIFSSVVDRRRKRWRACEKAKEHHFEHLINQNVFFRVTTLRAQPTLFTATISLLCGKRHASRHFHRCCDTSIKLFADDANFFAEGDNEFELTVKVNRILDNISRWCAANELSLSPDKTCYSIFLEIAHLILNYFLMVKK